MLGGVTLKKGSVHKKMSEWMVMVYVNLRVGSRSAEGLRRKWKGRAWDPQRGERVSVWLVCCAPWERVEWCYGKLA